MGLFSKSFNPLTDLPDLSGKVIIVTGGKCVTVRTMTDLTLTCLLVPVLVMQL